MMKYKHALEMHRLYNNEDEGNDWMDLNTQQNFNSRTLKVQIVNVSRVKIRKKVTLRKHGGTLVCHLLPTLEVRGSNPGKGRFFRIKMKNVAFELLRCS